MRNCIYRNNLELYFRAFPRPEHDYHLINTCENSTNVEHFPWPELLRVINMSLQIRLGIKITLKYHTLLKDAIVGKEDIELQRHSIA